MSMLRVQPSLSRRAAACQPRASVRAHAVDGMYNHIVPNMDYVDQVVSAFPDAAVANPDEARALFSHGGYVILDIRTNIEVDKYGMMPNDRTSAGSVCIPFFDAKRKFENGRSVEEKTENQYFLEDVLYEFPDKEENILVMDFDGNSGAVEALDLLFDEGYENVVGMQGGYKDWFRTWDNKMKRRNMGEYQEHSWGDGETSCGIHASGAGFANQDAQSADFWKSF